MFLSTECQGAKSIGISGHIRPDGDCVGSTMALCLYLKKVFPETTVKVFLEQPPESFSMIKEFETIDSEFVAEEPFDVFFALDCAKDRLGEGEALFEKAKKTINIDHHISNKDGCGMVNYVVPEVGSTSELIYELIEKDCNELTFEERMDEDIALAIYIGMIHDTGVFQYSNTSKRTLEIAGNLITYGFDFPRLIEETFYKKSDAQNKIMAKTVLESRLHLDGRCISGVVTKEMLQEFGVKQNQLDGIVNQLRNTKGVDCAIFLYELESGEYKISLRANEKINVSVISQKFGGGGHVRAAGCTLDGEPDDIIEKILAEIQTQFGRED